MFGFRRYPCDISNITNHSFLSLISADVASEEDLVPLFKLIPGVATSSDGLACAKLGGLPAPLLARARMVMNTLEQGKPITAADSVASAGGAQSLAPGSVGSNLLDLFLGTSSFEDVDDSTIGHFKALVAAL